METELTGQENGVITANQISAGNLDDPIATAKSFVAARNASIQRLIQHRDRLESDLAEAKETLRQLGHGRKPRTKLTAEVKRGRPQGSRNKASGKEAPIAGT